MTRADGERAILEYAEFTGETTVYVIGSQAVYGQLPLAEIGVVSETKDIDFLRQFTYDSWWLSVNEKFGSDSDFDADRGYYVDLVNSTLPRLPGGWQERTIERMIRGVDSSGAMRCVTVVLSGTS